MRAKSIVASLALATAAIVIAGCSSTTQTTSGREWLEAARLPAGPHADVDDEVRRVANVEPTLRFPARIGIARVARGRYMGAELSSPTGKEAEAWAGVAKDLGPDFGEFIPVSPLIASMLSPNQTVNTRVDSVRHVVEAVRLAAARQHLDAVVLYEVDATADSKNNPLSIADWTLIGAFILPSQDVKAQGVAQAILLDVRNGYPYGTVQTTADDTGLAARFATHDAEAELSARVADAAVQKLAVETEAMLKRLKPELAELDVRPIVRGSR